MPRTFKKLAIDNIADGAVTDLFNYEWARLIADIADENKRAKAPRTLTIKLKVSPSEDRGSGDIEVEVTSSLAKPKPTTGTVYLTEEQGRVESYANDPKQAELEMEDSIDGR